MQVAYVPTLTYSQVQGSEIRQDIGPGEPTLAHPPACCMEVGPDHDSRMATCIIPQEELESFAVSHDYGPVQRRGRHALHNVSAGIHGSIGDEVAVSSEDASTTSPGVDVRTSIEPQFKNV